MALCCSPISRPCRSMIATLGWGLDRPRRRCSRLAACIAGLLHPSIGLVYALGIALPAWLFARLRCFGAPPWKQAAAPLGAAADRPCRLRHAALAAATLIVAVALSGGALALAAAHGGLNSMLDQLADQLSPSIRELKDRDHDLARGLDVDRLARLLVRFMVPADGRDRACSCVMRQSLSRRALGADFAASAEPGRTSLAHSAALAGSVRRRPDRRRSGLLLHRSRHRLRRGHRRRRARRAVACRASRVCTRCRAACRRGRRFCSAPTSSCSRSRPGCCRRSRCSASRKRRLICARRAARIGSAPDPN